MYRLILLVFLIYIGPLAAEPKFFWHGTLGYRYVYFQQAEPGRGGALTQKDAQFALVDDLLIGYGPISWERFSMNILYLYGQDWESNAYQASDFWRQWFSSPSMSSFLFPTRSMLRTHLFQIDSRLTFPVVQVGFLTKLAFNRIGSTLIGEALENTQTSSLGELFMPYLAFQVQDWYQGQFSLPFRTEIYRETPRLSNKTYSFQFGGRGFFLSYRLKNGFGIRSWKSVVRLDLEYSDLRYASIQYDKSILGADLALNIPFFWRFRLEPSIGIAWHDYLVRIPKIPDSDIQPEQNNKEGVLIDRQDFYLRTSLLMTLRLTDNWFFSSQIGYQSITPPKYLEEFMRTRFFVRFKVRYVAPDIEFVLRRTQRFSEPVFIESPTYD